MQEAMAGAKTPAAARLELALWQAEADATSSSDLYIWLRESGLPPEIALRLRDLIGVTARIGEEAVSLGKIVALKLIDFIKAHPNMAVGIALGAAISALVAGIPLLGPLLAPIAMVLGVSIGAIAGHRLDKSDEQSVNSSIDPISLTQDVLEIARAFFELFIEMMQALGKELNLVRNSSS